MTSRNECMSTPMQPSKRGSCVDCSRSDSYDNFVQCDHCKGWWHMVCANVSDSIADKSFSCRKCLPRTISSKSASSKSNAGLEQIKFQLKQVEEQRNIAQRELEAERRAFEQEKKLLQRKYELLQAEMEDARSESSHGHHSKPADTQKVVEWVRHQNVLLSNGGEAGVSTAVPNHNHGSADERQPKQDSSVLTDSGITSAIQAAVQAAVKEVLAAQAHVDNPDSGRKLDPPIKSQLITKRHPKEVSTSRPGNEGSSSQQKGNAVPLPPLIPPGKPPFDYYCNDPRYDEINKQLDALNIAQAYTGLVPNKGFAQSICEQPKNATTTHNISREASKAKDDTNEINKANDNLDSQANTQPKLFASLSNFPNLPNLPPVTPTPSQIAARQVMPRELPSFSGDPADWPIFVSSFVNSTIACGYSSAENLARLQKCLKGEAYNSVRSRLLLPDTVPQVLSTLQLLYGRPELLIGALLQKVRSVPSPKAEKVESLIDFGMAVQSFSDHLEAAGQAAHLSNPTLLMELVDKLPAHIKMQWATFLQGQAEVNLKTFSGFMSSIVVAASKVSGCSSSKTYMSEKPKVKQKGYVNAHTSTQGNESRNKEEVQRACCVCKKVGHRIVQCSMFKSLSVEGRWKCIQTHGLCRTCLNPHGRRSCRNNNRCGVDGCEYRHHPLLHSNRSQGPSAQQTAVGVNNLTHRLTVQPTLFRILPVTLCGPKATLATYAFLDDGSSLTLIEEGLVEELGIDGELMPLCLNWTGNVTRVERGSKHVELLISGIGSRKQMRLKGRTVQNLALDKQSLCYDDLKKEHNHLRGLPICSYDNALPRLIVGLDNLNLTVPLQIKEGGVEDPVAAKTRLGWCIYGGSGSKSTRRSLNLHSCTCMYDRELHDTVKEYFILEEVGTKQGTLLESSSERRARMLLEDATVRIGERFETGLLWKFDEIELPDSYSMALKRLECLERRMGKDQSLKDKVQQLLTEYQRKGYASPATIEDLEEANPKRVWYLPLSALINPKKPDKVRLIWDAAATVDGMSLNSFLLKGPDQLVSLPAILARFRQFAIGVTADIREMFHQISIRKMDRHSQRFLWRNDPAEQPTIFLMNVATFGSTCSPASAQFVKNQNAKEFSEEYPRAVQAVISNHYVDDFLDSFGDVEEASRVSREVKLINSCGGFQLKNWLSNKPEVLQNIGESCSSDVKDLVVCKVPNAERVLGLLWETASDVLRFPIEFKREVNELLASNIPPTKRQMLRCLMSIFDPLGLLTIVLIHGRILLQDVWRLGVQWDHPVCDDVSDRWRRWMHTVKQIENLRIPRSYFINATLESYEGVELHVFVDASELAYAAVAFFRVKPLNSHPICSLVAAKAKVAPLKPLSVPRLELQAAVLGSRLMQFVIDSHTVTVTKRYLWSDSATVLAWIRSDHRKYKQYVACRIGELLTTTDANEWRWVPTKLNPADAATKWGKGLSLDVESVWFKGPEFLQQPENSWPRQKDVLTNPSTEEELRPCHTHREVRMTGLVPDYTRFSKWGRLLRTTAYAARFIHNLKQKLNAKQPQLGILSQEELQRAEATLLRHVQWQTYPDEMTQLTVNSKKNVNTELERTSVLYSLCPIMDQDGILRVDSRVKAAEQVPMSLKFPIILPYKHHITMLIIADYHQRFGHANFETVVNEIRQRFYVSRLRPTVKRVVKNCQLCSIKNALPRVPRMAPLPPARLAVYSRPFSYVGLDYCGPFIVKIGRSNVKRWIALFTCLTVRAVHVEVAHSLTTASCIKCFRRFRSRRGEPIEVYSDNGTNFRGAARILETQSIQDINRQLASTFTSTTMKWKFIPPATPHMGGAWERLVRSIKVAMFSAYEGDKKLTDEDFVTLVTEAENMVNSRPLTYLPLEAAECESLTPNHFLLPLKGAVKVRQAEESTATIVVNVYDEEDPTPDSKAAVLESTWNVLQQQMDAFWVRWTKEYLPTLTKRTKWFAEQKPVEVGDLVLIVNGGRRNEWIRGRVKEVIPGADGRVRQAIVQTARGLIRRAVSTLAILYLKNSSNGGKTDDGGQCYGGENVVDRISVTAP